MKQNSKKTAHLVISLQSDTDGGVEVRENVKGTLPELSSLLTFYIVHFCHTMANRKQTVDGDTYDANHILRGIITACILNINDEEPESEELDE